MQNAKWLKAPVNYLTNTLDDLRLSLWDGTRNRTTSVALWSHNSPAPILQIRSLPLTFLPSPSRTAASGCRWRLRSFSPRRPSTTTPSPPTRTSSTSTPVSSNTTTRRPSPRCVELRAVMMGMNIENIGALTQLVTYLLFALLCALNEWYNISSTPGSKHCSLHPIPRFRWRRWSPFKGELFEL